MAGGKQSPRDKMIGMMYLVLTALLALNVSTSVLDKFISINAAFETTNAENASENGNKVAAIEKAVDESGNRPQDIAVMNKAQEVRAETQKIMAKLDEYKAELVEVTGGRDENGAFCFSFKSNLLHTSLLNILYASCTG